MKLAAGYAPEPAQQVGLHPDLFCSANDLPALGVSDFESPFAYGTGDGFFTPNEKYLIHRCRMFHNVILLSLILGTTLRNINLAGESSYCGGFFISPQYQLVGFILTGILADYLRQNKRSKVLAPGQCQGAAWRQVGLAETIDHQPNHSPIWHQPCGLVSLEEGVFRTSLRGLQERAFGNRKGTHWQQGAYCRTGAQSRPTQL